MKYLLIIVLIIGSTGCATKHWDDQTTSERAGIVIMSIFPLFTSALITSFTVPRYSELGTWCPTHKYMNHIPCDTYFALMAKNIVENDKANYR